MSTLSTTYNTFFSGAEFSCTNSWALNTLRAASYLTDPCCLLLESYRSLQILDRLTDLQGLEKIKQIVSMSLAMVVYLFLTPITAPLGMLFRCSVVLSSPNYIYLERLNAIAKQWPANHEIVLASYNTCFMVGGFSITEGSVPPPSYNNRERIVKNLQLLNNRDLDVICLYEVPDVLDADFISSHLPNHPFIIPVIGPKILGPSSMMYVASKYKIIKDSSTFTPFTDLFTSITKGGDVEITGRAQFSKKGFLSFEIDTQRPDKKICIISTHLQHSECPAEPELWEQASRLKQMRKIAAKVDELKQQHPNMTIILTGDLNLDEEEFKDICEQVPSLKQLHRDPNVIGKPTWGGEVWGAKLTDKKISPNPLTLDYTLVTKDATISTEIVPVHFDKDVFSKDALSDHNLLVSKITIKSKSSL